MSDNDSRYTALGTGIGHYFHRSDGFVFISTDPRTRDEYDLGPTERVPEHEQWDTDQIPMETAYYHRATENTTDDGMVGLRVAFTVYEDTETGEHLVGEVYRTDDGQNELMRMVVRMQDRIRDLEGRIDELEG